MQPLQRSVSTTLHSPIESTTLYQTMIDLLGALLEFLGLLDSAAQKDGPPTWVRRYRTPIRILYNVALFAVCLMAFLALLYWVGGLGTTGRWVAIAIVGIQLAGLLALLNRKRKK